MPALRSPRARSSARLSAAIAIGLSRRLSPEQYATWFRRVRLVKLDERAAIFAVPNEFAREWIASYYLEPMAAAVQASLGVKRRVELRVDPEAAVEHTALESGTPEVAAERGPVDDAGPFGAGHSTGQSADHPASAAWTDGRRSEHEERHQERRGSYSQGSSLGHQQGASEPHGAQARSERDALPRDAQQRAGFLHETQRRDPSRVRRRRGSARTSPRAAGTRCCTRTATSS